MIPLSFGQRIACASATLFGNYGAVTHLAEEYGLCRLVEHAMKPAASAVTIIDDVRSFANGSGVRDDATTVFVGVNH